MGDRVSIQFENDGEKSVVLFSHWDGMGFVSRAREYAKNLEKRKRGKGITPLDRLEVNTVMVDFIRDDVEGNFYLGATENDGDNSDNGHHIIKLCQKKDETLKPLEGKEGA